MQNGLTSFSEGSNPGWKAWASSGCHGFFRGNLSSELRYYPGV